LARAVAEKGFTSRPFCGQMVAGGCACVRTRACAVTLIYNYIYRDLLLMTAAIVGVLTFLFVAFDMVKVVEAVVYGLSIWISLKFILLLIPFALTLTLPTGLLAAVLIVFGRMSSDRELLAIKASGMGLAPTVAPVLLVAALCSLFNFWLVASVVPKCREEYNGMKHEIVTSNPQSLFTPEIVLDKIPGMRLYFDKKVGNELQHVFIWQLDDEDHVVSSLRADRADISLDMEHQKLLITLFNERGESYPDIKDITKVEPGFSTKQGVLPISLSSFYEKVEKRLAWMTLPEIEQVIENMQGAPTGELATPYLTEFQSRPSFAMACFTFVVVGLPLAIQTQRRETSIGVLLTLVIVMIYWLLVTVGKAFKTHTGMYPEVIIWAPNFIFQAIGLWLFYKANRK
jgi:lipopolysaccharide export system permease protein